MTATIPPQLAYRIQLLLQHEDWLRTHPQLAGSRLYESRQDLVRTLRVEIERMTEGEP